MKCLPILLLLLALPASAQTTLYMRNQEGPMACSFADEDFDEARGSSAQTFRLTTTYGGSTQSWADDLVSGQTRDGTWDCTLNISVNGGAGPPNRATVRFERVNSSCAVQELIFEEETGTLPTGATTNYECTGASASITFASGEGVMVTVWKSNGTRLLDLNYNGADTDDSEIIVPPQVVSDRRIIIIQ